MVLRSCPDRRYEDVRELAASSHGLVGLEELRGVGLGSATISDWSAGGRLVRLAPRVYLVTDLLDDRSHLAALCRSSPKAVAPHRAAANLWGLDGIDVDVVAVTVPHRTKVGRGIVHRSGDLVDLNVVEVDGIRCTDPTRTLVDLGAVVPRAVVERALESALRHRLTTVERLHWRRSALARRGRAGPAVLKEVLDRRRSGVPPTESNLETLFLQCLRAAGAKDLNGNTVSGFPTARLSGSTTPTWRSGSSSSSTDGASTEAERRSSATVGVRTRWCYWDGAR